MDQDMFLNCLLGIIGLTLMSYALTRIVSAPFSISVSEFPTFIRLTYTYGFRKYEARLQMLPAGQQPKIIRSFKYLSFAIPYGMDINDVEQWLIKVRINKEYSTKGVDAFELLRAVLLAEETDMLDKHNLFNVPKHRLIIRQCITDNSKLLQNYLGRFKRFDYSVLPKKLSMYRVGKVA